MENISYNTNSILKVSSSGAIRGIFEDKYGKRGQCKIKNMSTFSIPVQWSPGPYCTMSYALTLVDYDAVPVIGFPWIHWLVANIPRCATSLPENCSRHCCNITEGLTSFAEDYLVKLQDISDFRVPNNCAIGYGGFAPPDKPHLYTLKIFALNYCLNLQPGFMYNELLDAMKHHVLAEGTFEAFYLN